MLGAAVFGAVFFGLASYAGIVLGGAIDAVPFDDGPAPAEPPVLWIAAGAALIGAFAVRSGGSHLAVDAIVICALSAIWCTDSRYGIVPDAFTLVPLGIVLAIALVQRQPWPMLSAIIAFVPFAALAAVSKGRGLGWGDVKLAALGGSVLGGDTALLVFAAGGLIAVIFALVRGRRRQAIAFAPYLAGAIAIALPLASA